MQIVSPTRANIGSTDVMMGVGTAGAVTVKAFRLEVQLPIVTVMKSRPVGAASGILALIKVSDTRTISSRSKAPRFTATSVLDKALPIISTVVPGIPLSGNMALICGPLPKFSKRNGSVSPRSCTRNTSAKPGGTSAGIRKTNFSFSMVSNKTSSTSTPPTTSSWK